MAARLTQHFTVDEFRCRCGCGHCDMDADYMTNLEKARVAFDKPMVPSSGFRCSMHNSKVSRTGPKGPHTLGVASDWPVSGSDAYRLILCAMHFGIKRIGVNQKGPHAKRFIHLDDAPTPDGGPYWIYSY